jgi:hypothetical protein
MSQAVARDTVIPVAAQAYNLVLLPGEFTGPWNDAVAWAKEQGGELPTRAEQLLLLAQARDEFKKDWYWSSEQHAGDSASAWFQDFDYGGQNGNHKGYELRARAVRRLPI